MVGCWWGGFEKRRKKTNHFPTHLARLFSQNHAVMPVRSLLYGNFPKGVAYEEAGGVDASRNAFHCTFSLSTRSGTEGNSMRRCFCRTVQLRQHTVTMQLHWLRTWAGIIAGHCAQHEVQDRCTTAWCIVQPCSETHSWKQPCAATGFHPKCSEVKRKILLTTAGFGWSQHRGNRTDTYHKQGCCFSFRPLIDFVIHLWFLTTFSCKRLS